MWPGHLMQTAEIPHQIFSDISNHTRKTIPAVKDVKESKTSFQRQTFISILKVIVLVLFQFGVESITPLNTVTRRTGSSSEPISMECIRTITHASSHAPHAPPLHFDPSFLPLFQSISLHCFIFFLPPSSPHCLLSFQKTLPLPRLTRIGGKQRDGGACQQTTLPGSEDHVCRCSEEK